MGLPLVILEEAAEDLLHKVHIAEELQHKHQIMAE
jgi:hypothetical protein